MGTFIVFEGGDGAGKTAQARILSRRLHREGREVVLTREPGGTALGEAVRRWLKTRSGLAPLTELLLFISARSQHVEKVIAPALNSQRIVICDRFAASTMAYQGCGRGQDLELIKRLNEAATQGIRPDLTVVLDIPVETGLGRREGVPRDNFESEMIEFHQRVREAYLRMASAEPDRWVVVDGTLKKGMVTERIWAKVHPLL